jgi:CHAD domain-containing protein
MSRWIQCRVPSVPGRYLAADGAAANLETTVRNALTKAVRRGVQPGRVVDEPVTKFRRAWFDTFDWRLHKAGLMLERIETSRRPDATTLVLTADAAVVNVPAAGGPGPQRAAFPLDAVVPDGELRRRLEPVVEMRALVCVASVRVASRTFRVLNDDDKTVARVTVDRSTVAGREAAVLPPRVTVVEVRGYPSDARSVDRMLAKIPGLVQSPRSAFGDALDATGRVAGDYSSKLAITLAASTPASDAARQIMAALLDAAQRNIAGVVADTDTEFLHDLRVAVRRARSALKLIGHAVPDTDEAGAGLKWLGDLTTPTRDLDVYLLGLDALAAEVTVVGWDPAQLDPFRRFLGERRADAHAALVRGLRSARAKRAFAQWAAVGDADADEQDDERAGMTIDGLAKDAVAKTFGRVISRGRAITASSPPSDLHDLRKRCKELRYALEIFASLHEPRAQRALVDDLKVLQDCLGEFQDTEVQQHAIKQFAQEMLDATGRASSRADGATVQAVMAMGRLADRLVERQQLARDRFGDLFAQFAQAHRRARIAALYETAKASR